MIEPQLIPLLLFLTVAAIGIPLTILAKLRRQKRLRIWAKSQGLDFTTEKDTKFDKAHPCFECFQMGTQRCAQNIASGKWGGLGIIACDYYYYQPTEKGSGNHYFSCVIVRSQFPLKELFIRSEGSFDKFMDFVGKNDIDFESAEFSHRFYVKAKETKWAYDVLHVRAIEFLLERLDKYHCIEFGTNEILITKKYSKPWSSDEFGQAIEITTGLLSMIPEYAKHD